MLQGNMTWGYSQQQRVRSVMCVIIGSHSAAFPMSESMIFAAHGMVPSDSCQGGWLNRLNHPVVIRGQSPGC